MYDSRDLHYNLRCLIGMILLNTLISKCNLMQHQLFKKEFYQCKFVFALHENNLIINIFANGKQQIMYYVKSSILEE